MDERLKSISVAGFKSIARLENFKLREVNVLIGANGAGKSNFIALFRLLYELTQRNLGVYCAQMGGADSFLFLGRARTPELSVALSFGNNGYEFTLVPTTDDRFVFKREGVQFDGNTNYADEFGTGHSEAKLPERKDNPGRWGAAHGPSWYAWNALSSWVMYHFDNTNPEAPVRLHCEINDNDRLRRDASNLAAYLYRLKLTQTAAYEEIRNAIRQAAPFFDDFRLRPDPLNPARIQLEWSQRGSDHPFRAVHLSDGTLRFICLATALLDPQRPATVLFDEPELGLHPAALTILAALFRFKSRNWFVTKQIIATTQSAPFLSEFQPEEVIVVDRDEASASTFRRLEAAALSEWLSEYTLGDLWQMNLLGARPSPDAPNPERLRNSG
ncbi:MAG: AAA family ATPase [Terriglobales bacterium]